MILSNASLVRSPGRFVAGLRHLAAALAVVAFASGTASAQFVYTFDGITNNDPGDVAIGETQLKLTVNSLANNQVSFTFTNTGTQSGAITDFYFLDGTLLTSGTILDVTNDAVSFSSPAKPAKVSGLKTDLTTIFSAGSQTPADGVSAGESLTVVFTLGTTTPGTTALFSDIIAALYKGNTSGGLVVAVKFQDIGLDGKGSETLRAVPEPASIAMLGFSSLVGFGYAWRRRKQAVA